MGKDIKKFTNTNIPVTFQKVSQFDSRFVQVKIWLMHLGENYNGSVFTKESVERAIPSLKNTPILGYVQDNAIGKDDFAGHEMELVVKDGDYKFKYLGSAFGVIPETNNARWETKAGDDGIEREYLVVDGLMWSKFDDAVDILERDELKGQSMELHDDYDGSFNDDGLFVFEKFSFYGACILGDGYDPAMQRATVEKAFSTDALSKEVNSMMEEFKNSFGKFNAKEGNDMNLEQLLEKYNVTVEQLEEKGINSAEFSIEELEAKIQEEFANAETDDNSDDTTEDADVEADSTEYSEDSDASESPQDDAEGDFESTEGDSTQKEEDAPEGDSEDFESNEDEGDKEENVEDYSTLYNELKSEYDELASKYESVSNELNEFKRTQHETKANDLFARFELDEEEISDLKEGVHNFTIEEIEEKLFARVGRKNFSKSNDEMSKVAVQPEGNLDEPNGYEHLFSKHGYKN